MENKKNQKKVLTNLVSYSKVMNINNKTVEKEE